MPANITDSFNESTTNGRPVAAALTAQKIIGATTLTVDSTAEWPTATAVHFTMFKIDANNTEIANTRTDWKGIVASSTSITNLTLQAGTDIEYPIGSKVICAPTAAWADDLVEGLLVSHDQDGTLKADSVDVTAVIKDAIITPAKFNSRTKLGWFDSELPAVSSVTHNGNRSYTVAFASTVASILSEGMRLEFTKTVAGNGYMGGAFNGSSHYFTKTSPTGTLGTVTNNFTIEAVVQPTSYADGTIAARLDSGLANGFRLSMTSTGIVSAIVWNAGAANSRSISTYQSLPLNKKTHVAASWTGGTVVIYFDGVSVPVAAAATGGTAPTTAGTGGDFSIGRNGAAASLYFPGYISNVAVFDAVLSAATIRQHATYKLTGSETNCIGAWSLDNTANDQSSAGNNLTATGGVGFTAQTPHGQLGNGVETTKAVGLVMNVNGTDVTVQTPEGVTIPTTGGITSVAYSTQANPFGWVSDKGRWEVGIRNKGTWLTKSSPTASTWYNLVSFTVPAGAWTISNKHFLDIQGAGLTYMSTTFTLSTSASSSTNQEFTSRATMQSPAAAESASQIYSISRVNLSSATVYYLNQLTTTASVTSISMIGDSASGDGLTVAIPSNL